MPNNSLQTINIETKILVIRGQQVMLDRDLAELYGVDVRTLNYHIQQIYNDNELTEGATIRNFRIVQTEGSR